MAEIVLAGVLRQKGELRVIMGDCQTGEAYEAAQCY